MIVAVTGPGIPRSDLETVISRNGVATGTSEINAATDLAVAVVVDRLPVDGTGIRSATGNAVPTKTRTELGIGRALGPATEITTVADVIVAGREVVSAIEKNIGLVVADIPAPHPDVAPVLDAHVLAHALVIATEIAHALDHGHPPLGDVRGLARLRGEGPDLVIDREKDALRLDPSPLTAICLSPAIGASHRGVEYAPQKEIPGLHGLASQIAICPPLNPRKPRKEK